MVTSYHVHSRFSDGRGELIQYIQAANKFGLDELGFSDHYVLTPDGSELNWSMALDGMDAYVHAVQSVAKEAEKDLVVRLGIEVDYFPETADNLAILLKKYPFDYVIGSVHFLDGFVIDGYAEIWKKLTQLERNDTIRRYWNRLREMAESGLFDIAGHLDLSKKFGHRPSVNISNEISETLDAIANADMAVEINTAGWYAPCAEEYPEPSIIRGCFQRGIPVLVTADAHEPMNLRQSFDRAYNLLADIGYTEIASYAGRKRKMQPLALGK